MDESEREGQENQPQPVDEHVEEVSGALLARRKLFQQLAILAGAGALALTSPRAHAGGVSPDTAGCSGSFTCGVTGVFSCPAPFYCQEAFGCYAYRM